MACLNVITVKESTRSVAGPGTWSAVASMALCVALLIAAEFLPVSLLTPIARDLGASDGAAGQAISISGFFAVVASLISATIAARFDRKYVLMALTGLMLVSVVVIAEAPNFAILMLARAVLGLVIGGFWSLSTATVMRLVPERDVPKALGIVYMGNAIATALAAPLGSYLGGLIGWRGAFWALVPISVMTLFWQWFSLPALPPQGANPVGNVFRLLRRPSVARAMIAVMLTFAGAFATFTYLRPFLETYTHVTVPQLSLLLFGLGVAAFFGTYASTALVHRHLFALLAGLPMTLAAITLALIVARNNIWAVAAAMVFWGVVNSAIPVAWSSWLSKSISDEPESGGGLMVAAIQLAIMLGAAFGGLLLDHISIVAAFAGGATLLILAAVILQRGGSVIRPPQRRELQD